MESPEVCGKVIVATKQAEIPLLEKLFAEGIANGLDVRRLDASEVHEFEPHVKCLSGIHVPSTGIVDFAAVCFEARGVDPGKWGRLRLGTHVQAFHTRGKETMLETSKDTLKGRCIINCAGLHSDRVARLAGTKPNARIVPFRGEYYELKPERRHLVRNLIYPVPDPEFPFLGCVRHRELFGGKSKEQRVRAKNLGTRSRFWHCGSRLADAHSDLSFLLKLHWNKTQRLKLTNVRFTP